MNVQIGHPLAKAWVPDRVAYLEAAARGRRVLHLGFADAPFMDEAIAGGEWLHSRLLATAEFVHGIDVDRASVERARSAHPHTTFSTGDITDPDMVAAAVRDGGIDLIVLSEIIEHLGSPGAGLASIASASPPGMELIVTTPNTFGFRRVLHALIRDVEIVHPDHRAYFSSYTLAALLDDHGWSVVSEATYRVRARLPSRLLDAALARIAPQCLPGLIVHATRI